MFILSYADMYMPLPTKGTFVESTHFHNHLKTNYLIYNKLINDPFRWHHSTESFYATNTQAAEKICSQNCHSGKIKRQNITADDGLADTMPCPDKYAKPKTWNPFMSTDKLYTFVRNTYTHLKHNMEMC